MIKIVPMGSSNMGLRDGLVVYFYNNCPGIGAGYYDPTTALLRSEGAIEKAGYRVVSELSETGVRYNVLRKI